MSRNQLRLTLSKGAPAFGGWCSIASSFSAELVASSGCDYVTVDMQHGLAGFADLVAMLQAISLHGPTPLVRIPVGDLATAQRALDAGAEGIIVPYVGSRFDAVQAVAACRYPPNGNRSYGPIRSRLHLGADAAQVNAEVMCILMIETREGLENLEEIVGTPGVDAIYVGPADLALSLGADGEAGAIYTPGRKGKVGSGAGDPLSVVEKAIDRILNTCRSHGTAVGIHAPSGVDAAAQIARGFAFATVATDAVWLSGTYRAEVDAAHAHLNRL